MYIKRTILFLIIICILSCNKEESTEVPSYLKIDNILLDDNSTHNITDAWIYIDDNLQGVYELPAHFPLLVTGKHKLRIKAGIKENGISTTRVAYPFYSSFIIEEQEFSIEEIISITPQVNYLENTNFFIEDFEGIGINLETTPISDTMLIEFQDADNKYGGGILFDSLITFEIATQELIELPQQGAPVYLELDYKSNSQFLVGVYANFPQSSVVQKDLLWVNPKEDWNKIYVNLTNTISESIGAESFKVFIGMGRDFSLDTNRVYFDNLRVVY